MKVPLRFHAPALAAAVALHAAIGATATASTLPADDFVDVVLTANPGLAAMAEAVNAAQHRIAVAGALDDPRAGFAVAPGTLGDRPLTQWTVSQSLPWPGKRELRREVARLDARSLQAEERTLRLELDAAARGLYAEWAYVHEALAINAAHQTLAAELVEQVHTLLAAGRAGRQDLVQADTRAARLRADRLRLEQARHETTARMNALRGRPADAPLGQPEPFAEPPGPRPPAASAGNDAAHPELVALRLQRHRARSREALAERNRLPDFTLSTSYNELWDASANRWTVGLSVNVPLDLGGKRSGEIDAARAQRRRVERQIDALALRIDRERQIALSRLDEARGQVALLDDALLPLAEQNLEAARDAYASGEGRFLEVLDAQRQQLELQAERARARADHYRALAELERWNAHAHRNGPDRRAVAAGEAQ